MFYTAALGLVQKHIFTGTGNDGKVIIAHHICDLIAVTAGAVKYILAANTFTGGSGNQIAICLLFDGRNRKIPHELHPIIHRIANRGDGQVIGADNARIGNMQHTCNRSRKIRLDCPGFLTGEDLKAGRLIDHAPLIKLLYSRVFLFPKGADHRSVLNARHVQLFCSLIEQFNTNGIQLRLQRTRFRVVAAVNNAAVCPAGTGSHIIFLFQQTNR